jgi:hypothetical protein
MMSGTIFKNVVVPGRFIYKLLKALPSGSPFTSILTTLVNWLNWSTLVCKYSYYPNDFKMNLFGDDTIILLPNCFGWSETRWAARFKAYCGYALDPCEIKTFFARDWVNKPSFLKTKPNHSLPARDTRDLILSLSFTRGRNKRSYESYRGQVTGSMYSAPFNFAALEFAMNFRRYLTDLSHSDSPALQEYVRTESFKRVRDNVSYKVISRNYLVPKIFGYEVTKNVDLGNKPKKVQKGYTVSGTNINIHNMPLWLCIK